MKKFTRGRISGFLSAYASQGKTLDIGAGSADHTRYFPNRTTLDIDPARKPDIVSDAAHTQLPDASYDVVICSEVFEHLPDPHAVVKEIDRLLVPGGLLLLTTRATFPLHDVPGDFWRYTPYSLRMLFENWELLELRAEAGTFSTIAILLQRIIFQTDLRGGRVAKSLLYLLALVFDRLDPLIRAEYGNIQRTVKVDTMLASGLYVAARKRVSSRTARITSN